MKFVILKLSIRAFISQLTLGADMKIKRVGKLWDSGRVADYLGISQMQALKLMESEQISSLQMSGEKRFRTTKVLVKCYLKQFRKQNNVR
jgi:hypothetical protein